MQTHVDFQCQCGCNEDGVSCIYSHEDLSAWYSTYHQLQPVLSIEEQRLLMSPAFFEQSMSDGVFYCIDPLVHIRTMLGTLNITHVSPSSNPSVQPDEQDSVNTKYSQDPIGQDATQSSQHTLDTAKMELLLQDHPQSSSSLSSAPHNPSSHLSAPRQHPRISFQHHFVSCLQVHIPHLFTVGTNSIWNVEQIADMPVDLLTSLASARLQLLLRVDTISWEEISISQGNDGEHTMHSSDANVLTDQQTPNMFISMTSQSSHAAMFEAHKEYLACFGAIYYDYADVIPQSVLQQYQWYEPSGVHLTACIHNPKQAPSAPHSQDDPDQQHLYPQYCRFFDDLSLFALIVALIYPHLYHELKRVYHDLIYGKYYQDAPYTWFQHRETLLMKYRILSRLTASQYVLSPPLPFSSSSSSSSSPCCDQSSARQPSGSQFTKTQHNTVTEELCESKGQPPGVVNPISLVFPFAHQVTLCHIPHHRRTELAVPRQLYDHYISKQIQHRQARHMDARQRRLDRLHRMQARLSAMDGAQKGLPTASHSQHQQQQQQHQQHQQQQQPSHIASPPHSPPAIASPRSPLPPPVFSSPPPRSKRGASLIHASETEKTPRFMSPFLVSADLHDTISPQKRQRSARYTHPSHGITTAPVPLDFSMAYNHTMNPQQEQHQQQMPILISFCSHIQSSTQYIDIDRLSQYHAESSHSHSGPALISQCRENTNDHITITKQHMRRIARTWYVSMISHFIGCTGCHALNPPLDSSISSYHLPALLALCTDFLQFFHEDDGNIHMGESQHVTAGTQLGSTQGSTGVASPGDEADSGSHQSTTVWSSVRDETQRRSTLTPHGISSPPRALQHSLDRNHQDQLPFGSPLSLLSAESLSAMDDATSSCHHPPPERTCVLFTWGQSWSTLSHWMDSALSHTTPVVGATLQLDQCHGSERSISFPSLASLIPVGNPTQTSQCVLNDGNDQMSVVASDVQSHHVNHPVHRDGNPIPPPHPVRYPNSEDVANDTHVFSAYPLDFHFHIEPTTHAHVPENEDNKAKIGPSPRHSTDREIDSIATATTTTILSTTTPSATPTLQLHTCYAFNPLRAALDHLAVSESPWTNVRDVCLMAQGVGLCTAVIYTLLILSELQNRLLEMIQDIEQSPMVVYYRLLIRLNTTTIPSPFINGHICDDLYFSVRQKALNTLINEQEDSTSENAVQPGRVHEEEIPMSKIWYNEELQRIHRAATGKAIFRGSSRKGTFIDTLFQLYSQLTPLFRTIYSQYTPFQVPTMVPIQSEVEPLTTYQNVIRSYVHYPLCQFVIFQTLLHEKHLKNLGSFRLRVFLKELGMPFEFAMQFWPQLFTKKPPKKLLYFIKHAYAKAGARVEYDMPNCNELQNAMIGSNAKVAMVNGETPGCIFRMPDIDHLTRILREYSTFISAFGFKPLAQHDIDGVIQLSQSKLYSSACRLVLALTRIGSHVVMDQHIPTPLDHLTAPSVNNKESSNTEHSLPTIPNVDVTTIPSTEQDVCASCPAKGCAASSCSTPASSSPKSQPRQTPAMASQNVVDIEDLHFTSPVEWYWLSKQLTSHS